MKASASFTVTPMSRLRLYAPMPYTMPKFTALALERRRGVIISGGIP